VLAERTISIAERLVFYRVFEGSGRIFGVGDAKSAVAAGAMVDAKH
jgi:hypothetical protein